MHANAQLQTESIRWWLLLAVFYTFCVRAKKASRYHIFESGGVTADRGTYANVTTQCGYTYTVWMLHRYT